MQLALQYQLKTNCLSFIRSFKIIKEKVTKALASIKSWKVTFKHEKGYSYINKPSIILVMHLKDIQRVLLRYITVNYPG